MSPKSPPAPTRILFIGNSFTARNDLPGLLARLAEARGHHLEHRLIQAGGASLRMHWNKGEAQPEIGRGGYDYVVLQEQSTLPIKNPMRMHENIRLFDEVIRESGAKSALYLTWARQNAPETQAAITKAYQTIGEEIGAKIVPVGIAWEKFMLKHDQPALYDADQSHPTIAGSYLAAIVFYMTLFDETPPEITAPKGMPSDTVSLINQMACSMIKK